MEAVLPSNINYLDTLPKAVPAERKRRNFFAANGTQYRPGQTMIIEISDPRSFLDVQNSFLRFTITNQNAAGGVIVPELGGGYAYLKNFRVQQAGNTIMNIQEYSRLYNGIIAPTTGGMDWKCSTSVYENVQCFGTSLQAAGPTTNTPATAVEFTGGTATACNVPSIANAGIAPGGGQVEYCVPLYGGLFSQDKLIPLPMLNQPIQLIFDLSDVDRVGAWDVVPLNTDILISNVRYCAEMVEVPRDVLGFLSQQQQAHGGSLIVEASSYEYQRANLEAGATGTQILNIPSRKRSIKSIQFVAMADPTSITLLSGAAGSGMGANRGPAEVFTETTSANPCLVSYQLRAGSMVMPPQPIAGPGGRNAIPGPGPGARAGTAVVAGLPDMDNNKGESVFELSKAIGHLGSTMGLGGCQRLTYANPVSVIAGAQCSIGTNWVAGQGQMGPGNDAIGAPQPDIAGGPPGFGDQWKFCPFAIDLEAYQNQAINSGLNTKEMSLQMTLHLEIANDLSVADTGGGGLAAAGGQSSAINFDIYSYHDILYYFNSDGTITFSD